MILENAIITEIYAIETGVNQEKGTTWKRQTIHVKEGGLVAYPDEIKFNVFNEDIAQLEGLSKGDKVNVVFSCRVRERTSKSGATFTENDLRLYSIEPVKV